MMNPDRSEPPWIEHIDSPYLLRYPGPRVDMTHAPIHRGAPGKTSWLDRGYCKQRHARHPMDRLLRRSQNHAEVQIHEVPWPENE